MTTIHDTTSARAQALGATIRTCGRMGRRPSDEEMQIWGDTLFALAREVRMLEAAVTAGDALRDIEIAVAAARGAGQHGDGA